MSSSFWSGGNRTLFSEVDVLSLSSETEIDGEDVDDALSSAVDGCCGGGARTISLTGGTGELCFVRSCERIGGLCRTSAVVTAEVAAGS